MAEFQESEVEAHGILITSHTSTVLYSLVVTKYRNQLSAGSVLKEVGLEAGRLWEGRSWMTGPWKAVWSQCSSVETLVTWAQFPQHQIPPN